MNTCLRKLRLLFVSAVCTLLAPYSLCQENYGYDVAIKNFEQTDETTIEWDICLRKAPGTDDFALYMMQVIIEFNNDILNTGDFAGNDFTIAGIGTETTQNPDFFLDNGCTVIGTPPQRQLNWAVTNPPNTDESMTLISNEWIHLARFRARLSKDGNPHHFADTCPGFAFQSSGNQIIVRRATNTTPLYDDEGSIEVPRNAAFPKPGIPIAHRQLAGYHFSGNGNWNDHQHWNKLTAEQTNTIPNNNAHNAIITGSANLSETIQLKELSISTQQAELPTVKTGELNAVAWNSGFLLIENNEIISHGSSEIAESGILIGDLQNVDFENYKFHFLGDIHSDNFVIYQRSGHGVEEGDYFRAYATSGIGTAYGRAYRVSNLSPGAEAVGGLVTLSGHLTITPGGSLTAEALYNEAGAAHLVIQSSDAGTASLIHGNAGVEATVEQYIPASADWSQKSPAPNKWYWISPPVSQQNINDYLGVLTEGADHDLYRWDEVADKWKNYKGINFEHESFKRGAGYLFAAQIDATYAYTGVLHAASHSWDGLTCGTTEADHGPGWHLIGNPYACGLEYNNDNWSSATVSYTPQYWVEQNGSYSAYTVGEVIPPSTAFFVEALEDNASLTVEETARTHHMSGHKDMTPSSNTSNNYIILSAYPVKESTSADQSNPLSAGALAALPQKGTFRQHAYIRVVPDISIGFDNRYHSRFRAGDAPAFCAVMDGERLLVHAISRMDHATSIPFYFQKNNESNTFRIALIEAIANTPLILLDHKHGIKHQLTPYKPYTFTSCLNDDPMRFELIMGDAGDHSVMPSKTTDPRAWMHRNTLNLISHEESSRVSLFDMNGRLLHEYQAGEGHHVYEPQLAAGIYVLLLSGQHTTHSIKIVAE